MPGPLSIFVGSPMSPAPIHNDDDIAFPEPELNMFQAPIDLTVQDRSSGVPKRVIPYPPKMSPFLIAEADNKVAKQLEKWFLDVFGMRGFPRCFPTML